MEVTYTQLGGVPIATLDRFDPDDKSNCDWECLNTKDDKIIVPSHVLFHMLPIADDFQILRGAIERQAEHRLPNEWAGLSQMQLLLRAKDENRTFTPIGPEFAPGEMLMEIKFYYVTQVLGEMCLPTVIDAIHKLPQPDPKEWSKDIRCSTKGKKNNAWFYMCFCEILTACLSNKAAIRYAISREEDFMPKLISALKMSSSVARNASRLSRPATMCLTLDDGGNLAKKLVDEYEILDGLATCMESGEKNDQFFKDVVPHISRLCSHLVAMGNADVKRTIESHEVLKLLNQSVEDFPYPDFSSRRTVCHLTDIVLAFAGETLLMLKHDHCMRISKSTCIADYKSYCSLPQCRKSVSKDGILRYCSLCRLARYCDRKCQTEHWTKGNHKANCPRQLPRTGNPVTSSGSMS